MRVSWVLAAVVATVAPAYASYQEKFVGWAKDNSFFVITQAGTDEMDVPAICLSKRGQVPASWPKDFDAPEADADCTELLDLVYEEGQDAQELVAKASKLVVKPRSKPLHGEKVALKKVGDGSLVEVTVSTTKPIGKAYFFLRDKSSSIPSTVTTYWREDGLAVAVEAGDERDPQADGYGPPSFVVVIPLDGSAVNPQRPKTPREESRALNIAGMKLLKAGSLEAAQKKFVEATEADNTDSIALYNLASVASLRKDSPTAVKAMKQVIELAREDREAKKAVAKAKTDHDLDFIASQSPYVAKLLGRPTTKGDEWCVAAEKRVRDINLVHFPSIGDEVRTAIDPTALRINVPFADESDISCFAKDGKSELTIAMNVKLTAKTKTERIIRVSWKIFSDGFFDADAFVDEKSTKSVRLNKLASIATLSKKISAK